MKKNSLQRGDILLTDDGLIGRKRKLTTGCGSLHMTAFFEASTGEFLELFLSKGSSGGCNNTLTGLSRMVSLAARGGIDIHSIIDQLKSSGTCPSYAVRKALKNDTSIGSSCPIAVGMALLEMHKEIQEEIDDEEFIEEVKFVSIKEPSNVKEEIFSQEQLEKIKKYGEISFAKEYNICPRCATKLFLVYLGVVGQNVIKGEQICMVIGIVETLHKTKSNGKINGCCGNY